MPKGKEPFSLKNMNGISHDDTRSCALSDMNCRRGQPDAPASLQDMNAAKKRPHKKILPDRHERAGGPLRRSCAFVTVFSACRADR